MAFDPEKAFEFIPDEYEAIDPIPIAGGVEAGGGKLTLITADFGQWSTGGSTDLPDLNFTNVANLDVKGRVAMHWLRPNQLYTLGFVLDDVLSCTDIGIVVYDPSAIPLASKIYAVAGDILTTPSFLTPSNLEGFLTVALVQCNPNKVLESMTIKTFNFMEVNT